MCGMPKIINSRCFTAPINLKPAPHGFNIFEKMKKAQHIPHIINSVSELHQLLNLPKPKHPLVSVIDMAWLNIAELKELKSVVYNFYSVCIKRGYKGKIKYGQNYYDFDEGRMSFFGTGQVISTEISANAPLDGIWLVIHPDFLHGYPLAAQIKRYTFFSYSVTEALYLSESEDTMIMQLLQQIEKEYNANIDGFTQDVIVAQTELLLNYCNRFYNRQFITRKVVHNELLTKLETVLNNFFSNNKETDSGLPTVKFLSKQLNVSPEYLSDMLKSLTGQTTQQHIHNYIIEKAKEILSTTSLSVSEIAYQLGFEHPQSFSKLFKTKTASSPLEFRHSFN